VDLINPDIQKYSEDHTNPESPLLERINRETHAEVLLPQMLSGHLQGRVLAHISQMIAPRRILEIGTFTGYSAICMAEGLLADGKLITIDVNQELEDKVRHYLVEAGLENKVEFLIGDALEIIPKIQDELDLVFIDADKVNYSNYFELVLPQVRKGGFILADNVQWSGKVVPGEGEKLDKDTQALRDFNAKVQLDSRVENVLLPIRDGLMIMRKI